MGASFRTFHLVEADEPHPLVARSLNKDLWAKCRIESPVAVHFIPMPRAGGCCRDLLDTVDGEVQLADDLLSPLKTEGWMEDRIIKVYLHELAHRLTPGGHGHDAAFFAVHSMLLIRSGTNSCGRPFLDRMSLYDLHEYHEWQDTPFCQIGEALDWALEAAGELADTELSAEAAAAEILRRYEKWKAWKTAEPARLSKARAAREAEAHLIGELRDARWRWAAVGWLAGIVTILMPRFL